MNGTCFFVPIASIVDFGKLSYLKGLSCDILSLFMIHNLWSICSLPSNHVITNLFDNHLDLHFTDFITILPDNICRIFQGTTFARFLPFRSRTRAKYQTNQIQMKKSHFQNFKNETKISDPDWSFQVLNICPCSFMLNLFVAAFPRTSNTISKFKKWRLSCFVSVRLIFHYCWNTPVYVLGVTIKAPLVLHGA